MVVLEGRLRGAGQSGKDTGALLGWNNHSLNTLQQSYGQKVASQVAQSHLDAIKTVQEIVKQETIPCQFTRVPGYIHGSERTLSAEHKAFQSVFTEPELVSPPCLILYRCKHTSLPNLQLYIYLEHIK